MRVRKILTDTADGQQPGSIVRWLTLGEERLQDVHAEGQGHDGLRAGTDDHALDPQTDERQEWAEGFHDVGIIGAGFFDHRSQLRVAVGSNLYGGEQKLGIVIELVRFKMFLRI